MQSVESVYQSNFKKGAYAFYENLRQSEPITSIGNSNGNNTWIVTSYDDVLELLKRPSFIKDQSKLFSKSARMEDEPMETKIFHHMMLDVDPPDHTRLRKLVQPGFNPKAIKQLAPRIEAIADQLIEEMKQKNDVVDLIDDFAFPLPIIVISELLGVPTEDRDKFRKWSNSIVSASDNMEGEFMKDVQEFTDYLTTLFNKRKADPQDDLISNLIKHEEDGEKLSSDELYSMVFLLIIAGHETTVNLIGNGMLALFEHPDQLELLQSDFSLTESAIEEALRFYSPVDFSTARWAEEDFEFKGVQLTKGDMILASISSANRDEKKFDNPNKFDITRKPNPHIAFGYGIHFCLGAPLARLEGKIAYQKLLSAFPSIQLAGAPEDAKWRNMFLLRGLEELKVQL
ncbi:cytochrome P450 [Alkalihalobacillus hwajinpoensis]|uniref:cytochrome P450 family protein n=1 Tax=Guptibacillus hwajinpoensis TaxID=208199 RepID=UPI001884242D|nr:cytochrome P450 [Pseudalkalibacillus hwajinpoensis]MBF0707472.1 cytochrome P450 [Pseudalkalibacillus hwajinpoensis]